MPLKLDSNCIFNPTKEQFRKLLDKFPNDEVYKNIELIKRYGLKKGFLYDVNKSGELSEYCEKQGPDLYWGSKKAIKKFNEIRAGRYED